ncbi:MAG TPA: RodZ domain-containing protein [Blastocatellia bacterium]|nr:RodZ domain-containing protein [Blastocatellia bacterium]
MPTLGEELRQRREQRGVTLAEISEATRIGSRFLKAIETDSFSILPGGIFTRSFIRAYAKYVGMNEDEAIALYLQQATSQGLEQAEPAEESVAKQPRKPPAPLEAVPKPATSPVDRPRRTETVAYRPSSPRVSWPTIVIGGGIVVFVVLIVLALVKQLNQGSGEKDSQATSVAQSNAPPRPAPQPASTPSKPAPDQTEQPASPAAQVPAGTPLVVKLEAATGDSWIRYQIDDAKPTTLILKQGESQDLPPAQTQVTLNYGNRMTLKLKINNRDANFPPDTPKFASQVVISRDNFQTYFQ